MPDPIIINRPIPDWLTVIVIGLLLWLTWVRTMYDYKWNFFIRSIFTERYIGKLMKDDINILQKLFYALFVVFIIASGIYLYRSLQLCQVPLLMGYSGFRLLALLCLFLSGIYVIKLFILKLNGIIFNAQKEFDEYINIVLLYNNVTGILLLPVVVWLLWGPYKIHMIYVGVGIIFLMYLYRVIRGLNIGFSNRKVSKIYLFYYLCALEICPMLVGIKLISKIL